MMRDDWTNGYRQAYRKERIDLEGVEDPLAFYAGRIEGQSDRMAGRPPQIEEMSPPETSQRLKSSLY